MQFTLLPQTDLRVSRIIFGCEQLGGTDWGEFNPADLRAAVEKAWDIGINTFDVADVYGLGRAEQFLADCLGPRRKEAVIITKVGVDWRASDSDSRAATFRDSSPQHIRQAVDASLGRLRVESIPLYMVHWPDPQTPLENTIEALHDIQRAGKIRYFGISNFPQDWIEKSALVGRPSAIETSYSLLDRTAEQAILPTCRDLNLPVLAYGVLAQGLLGGGYNRSSTFPANDRRHRLETFNQKSWEKAQAILARLELLAKNHGKSLAQTAIRWVLDHCDVSCAIVGAKDSAQVTRNAEAMGWHLTAEERLSFDG